MEEKIKIITIGDYKKSIVNDYFKDNKNIKFLKLELNENIEKFKDNISSLDIVFLRSNEENLEKLLEIGKSLKEREIVNVAVLEEKIVTENKEILKNSINTIFPVLKKTDIENLLLEILKLIDASVFNKNYIGIDLEDFKDIFYKLEIGILGTFSVKDEVLEKEVINSINYPFYDKPIGTKLICTHINVLDFLGLGEMNSLIEALKKGENIEEVRFSMRYNCSTLKNRVEGTFVTDLL